MKKLLTSIALASISLATADQYGSEGCSTCNNGYYQDRLYQGQMFNDGWGNNQNYRNNQGQMSNQGFYDNDSNQMSGGRNNQERNNGGRNNWNYRDSQDQMSNDGYYTNDNNQMNNSGRANQDFKNGGRNNRNYRDNQGQMSNNGYSSNDNNSMNNGGRLNQDRNNGWRNNQNYRDDQGQMSNDGYYNNDNNQMKNNNNYGNQRLNPDFEIGKKIHEKLNSGWFSKGFTGVSFRVVNGDVVLRGTIDTIDDKNKVEDMIRKIEGVKRINNQIRISKETSDNYSDSQLQDSEKKYPQDSTSSNEDRQLNAKIRDKLGSGWFSKGYENLMIRTTNGVVTISGNVDKEDDVQKINDQVKDIDGVRSVNNDLKVNNK